MQYRDLVIGKDTPIMISVLALHHDSKYWLKPYEFDPDRFNTEINSPKSFTERPYLPFGERRRNCIGFKIGENANESRIGVNAAKISIRSSS